MQQLQFPLTLSRVRTLFKKQSSDSLSPPMFLLLTLMNQREKFNKLNDLEADRIQEGLTNPQSSSWALTQAMKKVNRNRNRYSNVFPWDQTRIRLPVIDQEIHSDYINASRVRLGVDDFDSDATNTASQYIACQGPLESTIHHFWSMCFNESQLQNNDTVVVVMVTPLIEASMVKCHRYWPELNQKWEFDEDNMRDGIDIPNLSIQNIDETLDSNGDYLLTTMELKSNEIVKRVYHFYYFKWADAKVPPSIAPLYNICEDIENIRKLSRNPPVPIVHCSAGVGRSGTFIAFDYLFRDSNRFIDLVEQDQNEDSDLIYEIVYQMRASRMMMVQTIYQFNFLYETAKSVYKRGRR